MADKKLKILILDDEEGIVNYMGKILMLKGYDTVTACEGNAAVRLFEEHRPDICILDVHLTDSVIDGVEVLEKIKAIDTKSVCIMVTRITDPEKVSRARELGASRYLLKPIDTKDMITVVTETAQELKQEQA